MQPINKSVDQKKIFLEKQQLIQSRSPTNLNILICLIFFILVKMICVELFVVLFGVQKCDWYNSLKFPCFYTQNLFDWATAA